MSQPSFVAAAPQTRVIRTSFTTLFDVAAHHLGDPLLWPVIAQANGLTDPWITAQTTIVIPNVAKPTAAPTGILGL